MSAHNPPGTGRDSARSGPKDVEAPDPAALDYGRRVGRARSFLDDDIGNSGP